MSDRLPSQIEELKNGYIDISSRCIQIFCQLIFLTDFKPILSKFFTQEWYSRTDMASIIITFRDYLSDYEQQVHRSLRDLMIDSLADELLVQYLSAVRNKGAKFRRTDQFAAKMKDDLITAFEFFSTYGPQGQEIKQRWRAVEFFLKLLESDKSQVPFAFEDFKRNYRDVHISWVEAVIRSRDDFERSMLNAVKAKAADPIADDAPDDPIMGRVKVRMNGNAKFVSSRVCPLFKMHVLRMRRKSSNGTRSVVLSAVLIPCLSLKLPCCCYA